MDTVKKLWTDFHQVTKIEKAGMRICQNCMLENKSYFMALLIKLVEEGKLPQTEVIKFETTGEMSPTAKAAIWPIANMQPPEVFELEAKFKQSLVDMSKSLATLLAAERAHIQDEFQKQLLDSASNIARTFKKAVKPKKKSKANKRPRR